MSVPDDPAAHDGDAAIGAEPERPRWLFLLVAVLIVATPIMAQILLEIPDFRSAAYRFSWTMYSR